MMRVWCISRKWLLSGEPAQDAVVFQVEVGGPWPLCHASTLQREAAERAGHSGGSNCQKDEMI